VTIDEHVLRPFVPGFMITLGCVRHDRRCGQHHPIIEKDPEVKLTRAV
jgi:hypothetical protein